MIVATVAASQLASDLPATTLIIGALGNSPVSLAWNIKPMDKRYQTLIVAVGRAINEADPIGLLEMGAPTDEYEPEIGTILPRIVKSEGPDDVTDVLYEEFLRWFGDDTAGPRQAYEASAVRIWAALLEYQKRP